MIHLKWEVTNQCNLNCMYCSNAISNSHYKEKQHEEIGDKWLEVINYFGDKLECVDFLGGEPLLYRYVEDAIEECARRGIKTTLVTNGQQKNELGCRLLDKGLNDITISFEGLEYTHDLIRGAGTWKKALTFLSGLCKYKEENNYDINIRINYVITRINKDDLIKLLDRLSDLNVIIQITHLVEKGNAKTNMNSLSVTMEEMVEIYDEIGKYKMEHPESKILLVNATPVMIDFLNYKYNSQFKYGGSMCRANSSLFTVDAYGNIYGCNLLKEQTDCKQSVFESNYERLISEQADRIAYVYNRMNETCVECCYSDICHICPYGSNDNTICGFFAEKINKEMEKGEKRYSIEKNAVTCGTESSRFDKVFWRNTNEIVEYSKDGADILYALSLGEDNSVVISRKVGIDTVDVENFLFDEHMNKRISIKKIE